VILVYSVKSYCILKMSKNKEEFWYILKFYYKKGKNATQAATKICDVYGHDQYVWHKTGSSVFTLKILMSKMHLALVDQSLEKSMKSWKKLSTDTLAIISVIKHRPQNSFKLFGEG